MNRRGHRERDGKSGMGEGEIGGGVVLRIGGIVRREKG